MSAGVYKITIGDSFYIGSSRGLSSRERGHRLQLRKGIHHNVRMQRAWDKYGVFEFEVLEECEASLTFDVEQRYLDDLFDDVHCMNLARDVYYVPAWNHTEEALRKITAAATGRPHTDATKAKISQKHLGMKHTEEAKAKMRGPKSPENAEKCRANGMKSPGRVSSTGYRGVQQTTSGRYRASISIRGKRVHLGLFHTARAAAVAYQIAKERLSQEDMIAA